MKNYVQPGERVTATAPSGGVVSGIGYLFTALFGVACADAAEGNAFELQTTGVVELPRATGASTGWTGLGQKIYWDNTAKKVTHVSTENTLIGCAVAATADGDTMGLVRLNGTVT